MKDLFYVQELTENDELEGKSKSANVWGPDYDCHPSLEQNTIMAPV